MTSHSGLRYLAPPPLSPLGTIQAVLPPLHARLHTWYAPSGLPFSPLPALSALSAPSRPLKGNPAPLCRAEARFPAYERLSSLPLPLPLWFRRPVSLRRRTPTGCGGDGTGRDRTGQGGERRGGEGRGELGPVRP